MERLATANEAIEAEFARGLTVNAEGWIWLPRLNRGALAMPASFLLCRQKSQISRIFRSSNSDQIGQAPHVAENPCALGAEILAIIMCGITVTGHLRGPRGTRPGHTILDDDATADIDAKPVGVSKPGRPLDTVVMPMRIPLR